MNIHVREHIIMTEIILNFQEVFDQMEWVKKERIFIPNIKRQENVLEIHKEKGYLKKANNMINQKE